MTKYSFDRFGVMIDMSRNAVMNLTALKDFLLILKKMGYNSAMLYTEDTYEVNDNPYFGYMRGRYSKDEMKEIDAFAESIGIELIPCIQTLAHLNAYFKWNQVPVDCDDILLTDDEKTYSLIDKMFETLAECFKSRKIHVGMDEAHMLGRGRHLDIHGYEKVSPIIKRHLLKVKELAAKYGLTPMLWSDMFFRSWNNGAYYAPKVEMPKDVIDAMPDGIIPVYWNYYSKYESQYDAMFYNHSQLSDDIWFAGGAWSWSGIAPHNKFSLETMLPAMRSCRKNNVKNVFMTLWGDDGGECSHFSQLPALLYIIEYAKGNEDEASIKAKFKKLFGISYDDFITLDIPNRLSDTVDYNNPSKYMLYSDPFLGFLDYTVSSGVSEKYKEFAGILHTNSKKTRKFGYLFKTEAKLCELLSYKYEIGVKTRKAYRENDKEALSLLILDYSRIIRLYKELHKIYSDQWYKENKPHGFDIQDRRLGGMIIRFENCKQRLCDYLKGKISRIEELEEDILPFGGKGPGMPIRCNSFKIYSSANVVSH